MPHVYADTTWGAGSGHGWAVAKDRLVEPLSAMWTAQGRRTEIEGAKAVDIDRTFRLVRIAEPMAAHPDEVPEWAEPIEPVWTFAVGRLVNYWPSLGNVNGERRGLAKPLSVLDFGLSEEHWRAVGSNGWAVAADPHLPWKHEFRPYEVHLHHAALDIAGAGFIGSALPVFGRTPDVAWTWTANKPDHGDVYRLELEPGNPERYRFDGGWRDLERREVTYRLPDGGEMVETLRWSVHGPVTHHDPESGLAVVYWMSTNGLWEPPVQLLAMVQSKNLDDLERAMSRVQFASFNIVAADRAGDVLFVCGGRVPRRPDGLDAERPLDGSDPALVWDEMVPWSELPSVRRPAVGFVQNCNNDPQFTIGGADDPSL